MGGAGQGPDDVAPLVSAPTGRRYGRRPRPDSIRSHRVPMKFWIVKLRYPGGRPKKRPWLTCPRHWRIHGEWDIQYVGQVERLTPATNLADRSSHRSRSLSSQLRLAARQADTRRFAHAWRPLNVCQTGQTTAPRSITSVFRLSRNTVTKHDSFSDS